DPGGGGRILVHLSLINAPHGKGGMAFRLVKITVNYSQLSGVL
ncbi:uncharacterized protein METZ01_LOCUS425974, partial [marine metagenome]